MFRLYCGRAQADDAWSGQTGKCREAPARRPRALSPIFDRDASGRYLSAKREGPMRAHLFGLATCLMLMGCGHGWDKPGTTQAEFSQDAAHCRLMARGMSSGGFAAVGSPGYVASATAAYGIGSAITEQANYEDCMKAVGYVPSGTEAAAPPLSPEAAAGGCQPGKPCVCGVNGCHPG